MRSKKGEKKIDNLNERIIVKQLKYHPIFFLFFLEKIFIWVLVRIGFEPNEHQKKDGLKEAQDLSLAPYDR